ncbi:cell division ATP-binding protein FtsE [Desulfuromonas thiophila]|jgi:cell division transport system ATP-binding protein|uniref:Cell division ATP-binding protein FtsE n=1 Tax=Desulfuromonas thiophila TaxID=57664 RepID=A0A1G7AUT6_9BACT|nr:cell division ATP-binding protein FtsE [Desulfuromonas thiophila]SDE18482.1 cell division ATP-binding protein FtsE [Desulfuromonas thiophila]
MIQLCNIGKVYANGAPALHDVSLKIPAGDFVCLTGASGAGKSTLLRLLYCAERPSRGQILLGERNITRLRPRQIALLRRQIGFVFQDFKLLLKRSVFENVALPLQVQGLDRQTIHSRVYKMLQYVGLEYKLQRTPLELSGGEQQRVAIARAMIGQPRLLLADEPTGNLDNELAGEIMEMFERINLLGTTVLIASHDRELAQRFVRRTIVLKDGHILSDQRLAQARPQNRED